MCVAHLFADLFGFPTLCSLPLFLAVQAQSAGFRERFRQSRFVDHRGSTSLGERLVTRIQRVVVALRCYHSPFTVYLICVLICVRSRRVCSSDHRLRELATQRLTDIGCWSVLCCVCCCAMSRLTVLWCLDFNAALSSQIVQ